MPPAIKAMYLWTAVFLLPVVIEMLVFKRAGFFTKALLVKRWRIAHGRESLLGYGALVVVVSLGASFALDAAGIHYLWAFGVTVGGMLMWGRATERVPRPGNGGGGEVGPSSR